MSRVVIPAVAVSALLVWYAGIPASAEARQQSSLVDIEYEAALNDGELALADRRFDEAVEAFTEANARQAGRSARALYGLCRSYNGLGTYDKAASACQEGLEHASALRGQLGEREQPGDERWSRHTKALLVVGDGIAGT